MIRSGWVQLPGEDEDGCRSGFQVPLWPIEERRGMKMQFKKSLWMDRSSIDEIFRIIVNIIHYRDHVWKWNCQIVCREKCAGRAVAGNERVLWMYEWTLVVKTKPLHQINKWFYEWMEVHNARPPICSRQQSTEIRQSNVNHCCSVIVMMIALLLPHVDGQIVGGRIWISTC